MLRIILILLSAALIFQGACLDDAFAETLIVKTQASAVASLENGGGGVKARALEQALKNAVIEAAGGLLSSVRPLTEAERKSILADHISFITHYRVVTEDWISSSDEAAQGEIKTPEATERPGDTYTVWVEATIDIERLKEALLKTKNSASEAGISIEILDLTDFKAFSALMSNIRKTPSVMDVSYETFLRGRITLLVRSTEPAQGLAQRLDAKLGDAFEISSSDSSRISIKTSTKAGKK